MPPARKRRNETFQRYHRRGDHIDDRRRGAGLRRVFWLSQWRLSGNVQGEGLFGCRCARSGHVSRLLRGGDLGTGYGFRYPSAVALGMVLRAGDQRIVHWNGILGRLDNASRASSNTQVAVILSGLADSVSILRCSMVDDRSVGCGYLVAHVVHAAVG